jgi:hypothetical protein
MYLSTTVIESDPDITAVLHQAKSDLRAESVQLTLVQLTLGNRAGVMFLSIPEAQQLVEALTAALPMAVAR